jgi:hypothetical protein
MAALSKNGTEIVRLLNPSKTTQFSFRKNTLKSGTTKYYILKKYNYTPGGWGRWTHDTTPEKWLNQGTRVIDDIIKNLTHKQGWSII